MFEQFLMYWLLWLLFIIIFFFMEHSKKRTMLTIWLLFIIMFSSTYINIHIAQVSLSMIIIVIGSFIYMSEAPFSFLPLFKAFTIMIFYCGLLLWQVIAPVWFFLSGYFMIPVLVVFLLILLSRQLKNVYAYALLGISLGQFLFDILLHNYLFQEKIGTTAFFIQITLVILLVIAIRSYYALSIIISRFMTKSTL